MDYSVFRVEDGDVLTVDSVLDRLKSSGGTRCRLSRRVVSVEWRSEHCETIDKESRRCAW